MAREEQAQQAQLAKLQDAGEERVVMNMGAAKDISDVIAKYNAREDKLAADRAQNEAKLKAVKVAKEDVDMLATQFALTKQIAERALRTNNGDVDATIRFLVYGDASIKSATEGIARIAEGGAQVAAQ